MRTDDLIEALVADRAIDGASLRRAFLLFLVGGTAVSVTLFVLGVGFRSDIAAAVGSVHFQFKFMLMIVVAVAGAGLALRLSRPGSAAGIWWRPLVAIIGLLAVGVGGELLEVPGAMWPTKLMGTNSWACVTTIPVLALAPMAGVLAAMKNGAPTRPRLAGMAAGLLSAGLAAALYALNCADDSPLFVAIWYPVGIGIVVAMGAFVGPLVLRW